MSILSSTVEFAQLSTLSSKLCLYLLYAQVQTYK